MSSQTEQADLKAHDKQRNHSQVLRLFAPTMQRFDKLMTSYTFFNIFFLILAGLEVALFLSFFTWLGQSTVLAFALALFFLTIFSYAIIRLYFQAKKPEQLAQIAEEFITQCKEIVHYQEKIPENHLALANALQKFASSLHEKEYTYYAPPAFFASLAPLMEKFSAFCHWKQLHRMKELLLIRATVEHIKVIKCEPTNLQAHAALANAYVMLSSLYADPRKYEGYEEERWIPPERLSSNMHEKFCEVAARAIEEFKILKCYAPDDPWVHIQLAYSYHDLHMPEEEIVAYENILRLRPDDKETCFKLGMLYFSQGKNADGLRVYEKLKETNYAKAENLIKFYGAFDLNT
jgi:hypothetical protein